MFLHHSYLFFNAESNYNICYSLVLHKSLQIPKGQTYWFNWKKRERHRERIRDRFVGGMIYNPSIFSHCSYFNSFCNSLILYHFSGDRSRHVGILTCLFCHLHLQNLSNMATCIEKTYISTKAVSVTKINYSICFIMQALSLI